METVLIYLKMTLEKIKKGTRRDSTLSFTSVSYMQILEGSDQMLSRVYGRRRCCRGGIKFKVSKN